MEKTREYYCKEIGLGYANAISVVKEVVAKYGVKNGNETTMYVSKYITSRFWNCKIESFDLDNESGKLYVNVYWQGDSTDGNAYPKLDEIVSKLPFGDFVIPAEWDEVGGSWGRVCRHSPLRISREMLYDALKGIIKYLSPEETEKRENALLISRLSDFRLKRFRSKYYDMWGAKYDSGYKKYRKASDVLDEYIKEHAKELKDKTDEELSAIYEGVFVSAVA